MEQELTQIPSSFKNLVARAYNYKSYTDIMSVTELLTINADINQRWEKEGPKHFKGYTPNFERLPEIVIKRELYERPGDYQKRLISALNNNEDELNCIGFGDYFAMHVEETPDRYTIRAENRYRGFLDHEPPSGFLDLPVSTLAVKRLGVITWFLSQGTPKHLIVAKRLSEIYFSSETPAAALSNNIPATLDKLRK